MAQLIKRLTLNFSSGHDLTIREFEPHKGLSAVSWEPALDPLSSSLSAPPPLTLALSLSLSQKINLKNNKTIKKMNACIQARLRS